jgi:nicotinate-nucleotide adenylyltransferase
MDTAAPRARHVGLYGGTFDPVHIGHVSVAQCALWQLGLDHVRWLPAGAPWQKAAPAANAAHRVAMLELAVDVLPMQRIDTRELHRTGPTYTIDTIDELDRESPGTVWHLILGQDQFGRLHTWHRWRELMARVRFAVVARAGKLAQVSDEMRPFLPQGDVLTMNDIPVSSSEIRRRVAAGEPIETMVPEAVARYIDRHDLYRQESLNGS